MNTPFVTKKVFWAAAAVTLVCATSVRADDDDWHSHSCRDFSGPFSSVLVPPPTCTSPIGLCTHGLLTGSFTADYDFTFETLDSANDPNDPTKFVYSGHSVVTPAKGPGVMYTADTGVIHIPTDGSPAPFVTTAVVQSGTKNYEHVDGVFVASGNLDFSTGDAIGSFTATLCRHDDDHHGHGDDHGDDHDHGHH